MSPFFFLEIIMRKTSTPSVTMSTLDAQVLLDAIMKLEHRTDPDRIESGHYKVIVQLCQALEAPQFHTEYFARKATRSN